MKDNDWEKSNININGSQITDHVDAMLAYWDKDQVCRFANDAYRDWFGKTSEEMIDKMNMKELLGPLYEKNLPYINGALSGQKQVFERDIPLPNGSTRNSLATYFPDIQDGEVKGFFVHVANVTYIKELEAKVLRARQEMLRNVIETQEKERQDVASLIRDSVNQTLSYCKIIVQKKIEHGDDPEFYKELLQLLSQSILELKSITANLAPTSIGYFGFVLGTEDYVENFKLKNNVQVEFECRNKHIEELEIQDKLSLFRIIQNYLLLVKKNNLPRLIHLAVNYDANGLLLKLCANDPAIVLQKESQEFKDIEQRVEYYNGTIDEQQSEYEKCLLIKLNIHQL